MALEPRTYETILITKVDLAEEGFNSVLEKCKSAITNNGKGEMLLQDDWGNAKISYPIKKEPRGKWTYLRFKSLPEGIDEMHRNLKINENVLRNFTVRVPEDGSDYNSLRDAMPKELADREKNREWRDDRPRRGFKGRKFSGRGPRRDGDSSYTPRGDRDSAPSKAATPASDSQGSSNDA